MTNTNIYTVCCTSSFLFSILIWAVDADKQGSFVTGALSTALTAAGDLSPEVAHEAENDTLIDDWCCRYCGIARSPCVNPSVRLSHAGTVSKQRKLGSLFSLWLNLRHKFKTKTGCTTSRSATDWQERKCDAKTKTRGTYTTGTVNSVPVLKVARKRVDFPCNFWRTAVIKLISQNLN